jgi:hypothetical protein
MTLIAKQVVWTWCPRCMVRTKHQPVKTAFQCMDCSCLHNGEAVFVSPKPLVEAQPVFEQAGPVR